MKNLFKSMMLVAVAAMAFTACQKDNGELNTLTKKTIINGVATIENDNTRSGFVGTETIENEDGSTTTYYKSAWDGGENIKLFINYGVAEATATVDAEGKFTVELDGDYSESCYITACSPAEAWSSEYSFTIPAEQTPRTESVDPAAHILKAQAITVTNGAANFKMQHEVSYGKMTVNTPEDFKIAKVVINLKGAWYGTDKDLTYTLNATNVKNNTFWFATDTIEVSEMTVTAYDAEDNTYTKTVTMNENKVLKFQYYKVSTFSVSNLEEQEAPDTVMDSATYYYQYKDLDVDENWGYIVFEDATLGTVIVNCGTNVYNGNICIDEGTYYSYSYHGGIDPTLSFYQPVGGDEAGFTKDCSMDVKFKNGQYNIELVVSNNNGATLNATYVGDIVGLGAPDTRVQLNSPEVSYTAEGKTLKLSWEAVTGAVSYYIYNYYDSSFYVETSDTTVELTMPDFSTSYTFCIIAKADPNSTEYVDSSLKHLSLMTGKDPNFIAQYMWDETFVWDDAGYFILYDSTWGSSSYWRIYLNTADRPNNNSIKTGTYTGTTSSSPSVGEFTVRIGASGVAPFYSLYASAVSSSDTLEVKIVDEMYQIVFTHGSESYGYKGLPEEFVLPN